jgi:hypothetical protein
VREPSIKGSVFAGVVADLLRLQQTERLSAEEIEARLTTEDLAFLEKKIHAAEWYSLESYRRITELLCIVEGGGHIEYFKERGAAAARRLIESKLYEQLKFLEERWDGSTIASKREESEMIATYKGNLRLVISLAGSIYNVGTWSIETDPEDPGRARIDIRDAGAYSEATRYAIEGFLNGCVKAKRADTPDLFVSERIAPDFIVCRMNRDVKDIYRKT